MIPLNESVSMCSLLDVSISLTLSQTVLVLFTLLLVYQQVRDIRKGENNQFLLLHISISCVINIDIYVCVGASGKTGPIDPGS